jgi:hypothetical protein
MLDCLASYQSVTGMKRKADARTSLVCEQKGDQSRTRMLRYLTQMTKVGMLMLATSASMLMPSNAKKS